MTILMIPIGVAINFVVSNVASSLFPFIVGDAVGTILVGALAGPVPGAIVGLLTNAVGMIKHPAIILFAVFNISYGIIAGILARKLWFRSVPKTLLSSSFYAIIGSSIGTVLAWFILQGEFLPSVYSAIISIPLWEAGMPRFLAMLSGAFAGDLIDKLLAVIVVLAVIRALPTRFLSKMPNGSFVRAPRKVQA